MEATQNKPLVVIRCITYNHESYIRDCLNGFVMQKTTFPFVAVVHDDASTDKTADIIREYAEKYPDIIKPIYETGNQWSKHDGSLSRIMDAAVDKYDPKYVAYCEGDDCWTNPQKLQKQVDFLENNLEFGFCYSDYDVIDGLGKPWKETDYHKSHKVNFRSGDLFCEMLKQNIPQTCTILFRKELYDFNLFSSGSYDYSLYLDFAGKTKFYYIDESLANYRLLKTGATLSGILGSPYFAELNAALYCNAANGIFNGIYFKRPLLTRIKIYNRLMYKLLYFHKVKKYENTINDIFFNNKLLYLFYPGAKIHVMLGILKGKILKSLRK